MTHVSEHTMIEEIRLYQHQPGQLEKLYRANKPVFKKSFTAVYPELKGNVIAECWYERLHDKNDEIMWGTGRELFFIVMLALVAGLLAKLPDLLHIDKQFYYARNIGFIIFPALIAYFAWKNALPAGKILVAGIAVSLCVLFINFLPDRPLNDSIILACIHLLILLWAIWGYAFTGKQPDRDEQRLRFLKLNGDLVVMTTLMLIAGGIMSVLTIGLFSLIGFHIEDFYFENVVVFLLPAAPVLGAFLVQSNPQLVGKVSPVIAKLFSPVLFVMLVIYLVAMAVAGKNPYNDREFLLIFNALLIGVMAIIFFNVAGTLQTKKRKAESWILLLLSVVTMIVNAVALSAIIFRISTWGITPNRLAVLGSNLLILINLVWVTMQLTKVVARKAETISVGKTIATYLPVYIVWAAIVTFLFPLIFGFK